MKTNLKIRRGFTLVELLVVIVIIAALAGLTAPQVIKMKKKGDLAEATNNAKQLGLAFMQFDTDIGGYPDDDTIQTLEDITGEQPTRTLTGNSSNAYFRQFIEAGIVESEQPFFAKTSYTKSKPDDLTKGVEALKGGECGFGYVMKSQGEAITAGSSRPICVTPLKEGSTTGEMETDPYDNKSIVLFTDNSVRQLNIRKSDSKAILSGGNDILKGGSDETIWGSGTTPIMVAPELK
jgi:prepilin-type N-terminal cleavage/methylation domain-containing protein